MKLRLIITAAFTIIFTCSNAQTQPPNGGFETWTQNTVNNPDGFLTSNGMLQGGGTNVTKVTDAYHASFAARLETVLSGTDTMQGMLIIGTPGMGSISGGIPYSGTPDSVSVYVKFDIKPGDQATIIFGFKKNGAFMGPPAMLTLTGTQTAYKRFSVPTFLVSTSAPDTMVAIISSSNLDSPRKLGSTLTIDSITFLHSSQLFPNGDIENWTSIISGVNPTGWSSFNNFTAFGVPELSFKTTDVHSGTYALRLISKTAVLPPPFGSGALDTVGGFVFVGPPNMDNSGISYSDRPIAMRAFLKGTIPANGQVILVAELSKWNSTTNMRDLVGRANITVDSSIANYKLVSSAFNYNLASTPDTLLIRLMAGNAGPGGVTQPGIEFFIDDLSFSFPIGINENNETFNVYVFPNPTQGIFTITSESLMNDLEIINIAGEKIYQTELNSSVATIDMINQPKGIYFYKILGQGNTIRTGKIIVQ